METSYSVYKHTNKINKKVYIGLTMIKPETRWREGKGYAGNKDFKADIELYGWDNFTHEILMEGLTEFQGIEMEIKFIEKFRSNFSSTGYNRTRGGEIPNHRRTESELPSKEIEQQPVMPIAKQEIRKHPILKDYNTVKEIAEYFIVEIRVMEKLITDGVMTTAEVDGGQLITKEDVAEFIERQTYKAS